MARSPDDSKKEKILETACSLFGTLGYKHTTIVMVAEKTNIATGSIYTYFESKRNLYRHAIRYFWHTIENQVEEIIYSSQLFEEKIKNLCMLGSTVLVQTTSLLLGIFDSPTRRKSMHKHLEKICWKLLPLFKIETAPKRLRKASAIDIVYFLTNYISGILFQYLLMTSKEEQESFLACAWQKIEGEIMYNRHVANSSSPQLT